MSLEHYSARTLAARENQLGNINDGLENTAVLWTGILREFYGVDLPALPPHVCSLMESVRKMGRAARPHKFNQDHYIDGLNYLSAAHNLAGGNNEEQGSTACGVKEAEAGSGNPKGRSHPYGQSEYIRS